MDEVEYNGKKYLAFELVIDGAYNFFAEEGLLEGKEYDVILHASIMEKER